jgi:hypothetical protein
VRAEETILQALALDPDNADLKEEEILMHREASTSYLKARGDAHTAAGRESQTAPHHQLIAAPPPRPTPVLTVEGVVITPRPPAGRQARRAGPAPQPQRRARACGHRRAAGQGRGPRGRRRHVRLQAQAQAGRGPPRGPPLGRRGRHVAGEEVAIDVPRMAAALVRLPPLRRGELLHRRDGDDQEEVEPV